MTEDRRNKSSAITIPDGLEAFERLVVGLYSEVFSVPLSLVDRAIDSPALTMASNIVVDTPGFQNPATGGHPAGDTIEELYHNHGQKRLQPMFHDSADKNLSDLFRNGINIKVARSIVGVKGCQYLRRASSIKRAFTSGTASVKRHSAAPQAELEIVV